MPKSHPKRTHLVIPSERTVFDRLRNLVSRLLGIGQRQPVKLRKL
jgi:hypothetical protein